MLKRTLFSSFALLALLIFTVNANAGNGPVTVFNVTELGSIKVKNPTGFAYRLRLDSRDLGTIAPKGRVLLDQAPVGSYRIDAIYPGKQGIPTQTFRVKVRAGQVTKVRIERPMGALRVKNRNIIPLTLFIDGVRQSVIRPGAELFLSNLMPGSHTLRLRTPKGQFLLTEDLHLYPGRTSTWIPKELTGTFRLKNTSPKRLRVFIDDKFAGILKRNQTRIFEGIALGQHRVELRSHGHLILARELRARPTQITKWIVSPKKFTWGGHSPSVGFVSHN
jgi:hypothetical protein